MSKKNKDTIQKIISQLDYGIEFSWTKQNKKLFMEFLGLTEEYEFEYFTKPISHIENYMFVNFDWGSGKPIKKENILYIDKERKHRYEDLCSGKYKQDRELEEKLNQEKIDRLEKKLEELKQIKENK